MSKRIVLLGDPHAHEQRLEASLQLVAPRGADLVLLAGDVGLDPPWQEPARHRFRDRHDESLRQVIRRVREACGGELAFVPGNHDLPEPPADLDAVNLDGRRAELAGLELAGLGGAGPHHYGFPYEWTEVEAAARLKYVLAGGPVDIFLSHAPPRKCRLDLTAAGDHVGSASVRDMLLRVRPRLFVCGHIHEAWGAEWLDGHPCLNAGALGEPYGQVLAWVVDWDDGPRRIRSIRGEGGGSPQIREWRYENG